MAISFAAGMFADIQDNTINFAPVCAQTLITSVSTCTSDIVVNKVFLMKICQWHVGFGLGCRTQSGETTVKFITTYETDIAGLLADVDGPTIWD